MAELICPNCGSKVNLPEHSTLSCGMTLSKEDKGTYYLNMEGTNMKAFERIEKMKESGVDTSNFFVATAPDGAEMIIDTSTGKVIADTEDKIEKSIVSKFISSPTDRRWVMAQMVQMENYKNTYRNEYGYDAALRAKGFMYQFEMLLEELHQLAKMEKNGDRAGLSERGMFFTIDKCKAIINHYPVALMEYIDSLPIKYCKGIPYKRLGKNFENIVGKPNGDVFISDIGKVVRKVKIKCNIHYGNYGGMETVLRYLINSYLVNIPNGSLSKVFIDCYKGEGAFYTLKNMYLHHDIFGNNGIKLFNDLEDLAEDYMSANEGYKLLGFMRYTIKVNNINMDNAIKGLI